MKKGNSFKEQKSFPKEGPKFPGETYALNHFATITISQSFLYNLTTSH